MQRRARSGASSGPADLAVELARFGRITVFGAVVAVGDGSGAADRTLAIAGELATDDIVQLLVQTGAFDADGARSIVAATLGYTVATLPARIAFRIEATGRESGGTVSGARGPRRRPRPAGRASRPPTPRG